MSNIIVNKIGGAVLSSPNGFGALLDLVQSFNDEPNVLVISALGTSTRSLISCAEEVLISGLDSAKVKLESCIEYYSGYGKEFLNFNKKFQDELNSTKNEISGLLKGIHLTKELSPRTLDKIMSYGGFKMGIGGVLTYKKSGLDKTIAQVPLSELVLETDSPYLAPTPKRGKRNEPSYLLHIAEKLAEVKGESFKTVAEITTINATDVFGL